MGVDPLRRHHRRAAVATPRAHAVRASGPPGPLRGRDLVAGLSGDRRRSAPASTDPCVLVVAFRLRAVRGRGHTVFRWESLLNTPLFVGFPGFVSKLWLAHDEQATTGGSTSGTARRAEAYARSLWRVLALVQRAGVDPLPGAARPAPRRCARRAAPVRCGRAGRPRGLVAGRVGSMIASAGPAGGGRRPDRTGARIAGPRPRRSGADRRAAARCLPPSRALIMHPRTLEVLRPLGVVGALLAKADIAPSVRLHLGSRVVAARLDRARPAGHRLPASDAAAADGRRSRLAPRARRPRRRGRAGHRAGETCVDAGRRPRATLRSAAGVEEVDSAGGRRVRRRRQHGALAVGHRLARPALPAGGGARRRRTRQLISHLASLTSSRPAAACCSLFALGERATWRLMATRRAGLEPLPLGQPGPPVPAEELQGLVDDAGLAGADHRPAVVNRGADCSTGSPTGTATGRCSSRETPPTSTRRPAARA